MNRPTSKLFIDFETRSAVDLKKCGADVYARDPSTDIMCMAWAFDDEPVDLWTPFDGDLSERVYTHVLSNEPVIAHNAPFELAIWNHVGVKKYKWAPLGLIQAQCTMAMAYAMSLPGSLDNASAAVGLTHKKDMQGHRVMMQLSQPRDVLADGSVVWWNDPDKFAKLYSYCKQDIEVERELYKRLMPLSPAERRVWILDQRINQRGIAVDLPSVTTAIAIVEGEKKRLDEEMRAVTCGAVATCTAVGQLTDFLKAQGLEVDGVAKADVADFLEDEALPAVCRQALLLRQEAAKSSTAKFESMRKSACNDGRVRGIFQYHGAGTGRWAGRRIQPQNFPRPKISQKNIESVFEILGRAS